MTVITVARRPIEGTVAENVAEHETGALNIDASRIACEERPLIVRSHTQDQNVYGRGFAGGKNAGTITTGRWPANLVLSPPAAEALDAEVGERASSTSVRSGDDGEGRAGESGLRALRTPAGPVGYGDSGGPSRYFKVVKPGKRIP